MCAYGIVCDYTFAACRHKWDVDIDKLLPFKKCVNSHEQHLLAHFPGSGLNEQCRVSVLGVSLLCHSVKAPGWSSTVFQWQLLTPACFYHPLRCKYLRKVIKLITIWIFSAFQSHLPSVSLPEQYKGFLSICSCTGEVFWFLIWTVISQRFQGFWLKVRIHVLCFLAAEQYYALHTVLQPIDFWKHVRYLFCGSLDTQAWFPEGMSQAAHIFSLSLFHKLCNTLRDYSQ